MDDIEEKCPQDKAVADGVLFPFVGNLVEEVLCNKHNDLNVKIRRGPSTCHVIAEREDVPEYGESLREVTQPILLLPVEDHDNRLDQGLEGRFGQC